MVLILSSSHDSSTTSVIEWLENLGLKWIRINSEDKIYLDFLGSEIKFTTNENVSFLMSEIKSFWYRRGFLNIGNFKISDISQFQSFQYIELKKITEFIFFKLQKIKNVNTIENIDVNKLVVSSIARDLGINTPQDYLFTKKKDLACFLVNGNSEYITKSISGDGIQNFDTFSIFNYTKKIFIKDVKSDVFFPSLIQNYIQKKYELRVFYLNGKFYSMAIFSQKDDKTKIDFRNYNKKRPNRSVPFKLPNVIEVKLDLLMRKLNLNSGSIDIVVTNSNEYVFLEVNPIGQFGMTSYPCNYNLEFLIANALSYE
jgi:ATP-GRASP peptide maturase of grasp-with-spasm system